MAQGGRRSAAPNIAGVETVELGNVLTRSGLLLELFRSDWNAARVTPRQVNWVQMTPHAVTDWHRHTRQTDHLVAVGGSIRLALWDGRPNSRTYDAHDVIRFGGARPLLVIVPPGVWHALRNESGEPAGYLNIFDELYDYENPDNWRLPAGSTAAPDIL